jgi:hypothetical protein
MCRFREFIVHRGRDSGHLNAGNNISPASTPPGIAQDYQTDVDHLVVGTKRMIRIRLPLKRSKTLLLFTIIKRQNNKNFEIVRKQSES